ncbi:MAG: hypothetical protein CFE26_16285, partial [Verrucomicrobiales bacterium VVV1]
MRFGSQSKSSRENRANPRDGNRLPESTSGSAFPSSSTWIQMKKSIAHSLPSRWDSVRFHRRRSMM